MSQPTVSERIKDFNSPIAERAALKYRRMVKDSFSFFRGTCHLFYEDLSKESSFPDQAPFVWGCGDLHLENFGSYRANNRRVYFDLNDFDESALLPATWELARMVTSIMCAFSVFETAEESIREHCRFFLAAYTKVLRKGKAKHIEERLAKGLVRSFLKQVTWRKTKDLVHEMTIRTQNGRALFIDNKKRLVIESEAEKEEILNHISDWLAQARHKLLRKFVPADVCRRIAGMGSIGAKRFVVLLRNTEHENKSLLLDIKEGRSSSLQPYNPVPQPQWSSEAERIASVQERSQYDAVALLSTTFLNNASYVIRELQPEEDKLDFGTLMAEEINIRRVLKDMALLTASAHLRSAGRQGSAIADELIAFATNNEWQTALMEYAGNYTKQVSNDYLLFKQDYENKFFDTTGS